MVESSQSGGARGTHRHAQSRESEQAAWRVLDSAEFDADLRPSSAQRGDLSIIHSSFSRIHIEDPEVLILTEAVAPLWQSALASESTRE
jgi:hypothetical protein